jgi:hypothetical protein
MFTYAITMNESGRLMYMRGDVGVPDGIINSTAKYCEGHQN